MTQYRPLALIIAQHQTWKMFLALVVPHTKNNISENFSIWKNDLFRKWCGFDRKLCMKAMKLHSGAQLGGREGGLPCPILKIEKIVSWFCKEYPDCVHFWVKCSILNVVLRVSRRKNFQIFPCGTFFFWCFYQNVYESTLIPRDLPCPEVFLAARLTF